MRWSCLQVNGLGGVGAARRLTETVVVGVLRELGATLASQHAGLIDLEGPVQARRLGGSLQLLGGVVDEGDGGGRRDGRHTKLGATRESSLRKDGSIKFFCHLKHSDKGDQSLGVIYLKSHF